MQISGISVVIPTRNRYFLLKRLFRSLALCREKSAEEIQVIIVDYSDDTDATRIKSMCDNYGFEYYKGVEKVAASRNIGIRNARHDIIFFH